MNKQLLKVGLVALITSIYSSGASAAGPVDGTAAATIIAPVTLTPGAALNFGDFSPSPLGDTVTLTAAAATVRAITTGTLHAGTVSSGAFTIGGQAGLAVNVAIADGATDLVNGANTLVFTPTAPADIVSNYVIGSGTDIIYVGGTLTIPVVASAPAGLYSSATAYTVTVNYQ
ncbi:MAG: DUF4402 domain-containing protein [Gammaproteobacteria bacterium]|nr:DUF4402 domain-containing protein [Gammaproteobacteria bacterium]